jgi:hypothetical protein
MQKRLSFIIEYIGYSIIAAMYLFGCQKNETVKTSPLKPEIILGDRRDSKIVHLYSDTVYIIDKQFVRTEGQELVVDEGTLIKLKPGIANSGGNGGITIEPGGIITVNGTRNNPVVFTSDAYTGTPNNNWDGITITGKAKNNTRGNTGDSSDFSGSLTFVRIEFAPLTLDAVGSKTLIENVMVSYTARTGQSPAECSFKFLGGSFNAKNLISYSCGGAADFYITNGYNGKLQNILAYRNVLFGGTADVPANTLCGVLIENNQYADITAEPLSFPIISNLTVLGPGSLNGTPAAYTDTNPDTRSAALVVNYNAFFSIRNSLLLGFPRGGIFVNDASTAANIETGNATISSTYFHANDSSRTFFLADGVYPPNNSYTLAYMLLNPDLKNVKYNIPLNSPGYFGFGNPFNYNNPDLVPADDSPVLNGANFSGSMYTTFFTPVTHLGAIGKEDWTKGWANFIPLKTNYNFPDFRPF